MTSALAERIGVDRGSPSKEARAGAEGLAPRFVDRLEWVDLAARVQVLAEALKVTATQASAVDAETREAIVEAAERLVDRLRVILL